MHTIVLTTAAFNWTDNGESIRTLATTDARNLIEYLTRWNCIDNMRTVMTMDNQRGTNLIMLNTNFTIVGITGIVTMNVKRKQYMFSVDICHG